MKKLPSVLVLLFIIFPWGKTYGGENTACGETPSDVVIMLDRTLSVSPQNRQKEAEAAKKLVELLLSHGESQVAVGRFGAGECQENRYNMMRKIQAPMAEILAGLSRDQGFLKAAIDGHMTSANCDGTNLEDAIQFAHSELANGSHPNKVVILISDGDPNRPLHEDYARGVALQAAEGAKKLGVRIFSITYASSPSS